MIINNRNEIKLYALLHLPDTAGEMQLSYKDFWAFMQRNREISANVFVVNPTISTTIDEVENYLNKIRDYCSEVFVNFSIAEDSELSDEEFFSLLSKILELAYTCDVQYGGRACRWGGSPRCLSALPINGVFALLRPKSRVRLGRLKKEKLSNKVLSALRSPSKLLIYA